MTVLIDKHFRIFFDSVIENVIFLFTNNNRILEFENGDNGLYFYNTENHQVCILSSQFENIFNYTKRQIKNTKRARDLY